MRDRVLFVTETYPPDRGGMAESCDRIVRGLRAEGMHVELLHLDRRQPDAAHTINCAWNKLRAGVDLDAITHVVAFGGALPLMAAPAFATWIDRPLVTLLRGNELDAGLFDPRRRPMLADAVERSAAVCCVTNEQAEKVAALFGIEPRVIANGIDFDLWQAGDADRVRAASWRAQNVVDDRLVLGFFGHLKVKKGVPFFIDALQRSGLDDRVQLLLVGDSGAIVAEGLAQTRVTTVDRFDLIPFYLAADFVVIPSHYDGFPNVLIEAASLARPLIASRAGGMRDLLTDENAFLFDPGDEHGCRAAIHRALAAPPERLAAIGASAENVARQKCDARDEAAQYRSLLDEIRRRSHAQSDRRAGDARSRFVR